MDAMTDRFVPPRPVPPEQPVSFLAFAGARRTNALALFPRAAYEDWSITRRELGRTTITLSHPDAVRDVLVTKAENYRRTATTIRILRPIIGEGLFLSEGEAWRHQRRTIAPAMSPRTIPLLGRHVVVQTDLAVRRLRARARAPVDLLAAVQRLALEIAAGSMFSVRMGVEGEALRELLTSYGLRYARPTLLDLFFPAQVPTPRDVGRAVFRARWTRFIGRLVAARLAGPVIDPPRDLLDLLRAARDPSTGAAFTEAELRDQTATMIVAGHETTAVTMFWCLVLLAMAPGAQARVAAEADRLSWRADDGEAMLGQLSYTRAVVNEALRLYPPAFAIARRAIASDAAGGTAIPAGASIIISPWVLHRHRRLWDEPDAFDPERFLGPAPPRFAYLPFGAGPRVCIGAQFALAEATLALAGLARAFAIGLEDDRPVLPHPVVTTIPDHAPQFRLRPRVRTV